MPKAYHVEAHWDPEAGVWTSKSDIPGLVIETESLAEFEALVRDLAAQLLAANGALGGDAPSSVPVKWRAFGEMTVAVA